MKTSITTKILTLLTVAFCSIQANAQSPTAPAQGFNVFLKNGATFTTSESEGPVALGGNLTLAGSYNFAIHNNFVYQVGGVNIALLVGGKVNYNSGNQGGYQVLNSGYVKIGDSTGSKVWYNYQGNNIHITPASSNSNSSSPDIELNTTAANLGGVSSTNNPVFQGNLIDFNAAFSTLQATSTGLAACTDNMTIYNSPNGGSAPISHSGISGGTQIYTTLTSSSKTVLNINGSDLNNISQFTFQNPNGSTQSPDANHVWIINVNAPGTFTWSTPNGMGNSIAPYVIWNFYNTTTLNISGNNAVEGAVFAPYADITKSNNNSNIEGQVIGLSYIQTAGGEIHSYNFTQSVTGCGVTATPTVAGFTINTATQCLSGNSYTFTNTSTGTSLTYSWNFGDNTSLVTSTSPIHTYTAAGTYTVKVVATGTGGVDSTTHTVTVNAMVAPSVSITANPGSTICSGTSVTFTATPTNGGTSPAYQWKKNGTNVGISNATYTDASLNNNDIITCVLTSNAACAVTTTATSNAITMVVAGNVTPSVSIVANPGSSICTGTSVTFTANATNAGTPTYQWKKNGTNVGTGATYTDASLNNNDAITCVVTGNATCATTTTATSNTITMNVNGTATQPGAFTTSSSITYDGQTNVTYTVPAVAGTTYTWSYTGTGATITGSGNSISLNFSTTATGGTLSVTATTAACSSPSPAQSIVITVKPYLTWTCGSNNDWNTASNWDGGFVPYSTISVLIPSNTPCQPNVCSGSASVYNMIVNNGATVNVCCPNSLTVNGDLTINGSILGCGHVIVSGTVCHVIYGNGRVDNFELNNSCGGIINTGDTLHIGDTYTPTLGVMTVNGELELLSDDSTTASILTHPGVCTNYIIGDVICDKYIHGGRRAFRFFGHPFSTAIPLSQIEPYIDITGNGGAANGFTPTATNNPSAFWYNTITGNGSTTNDSTGWIPFTNTNGVGANAWNRFEGMRMLVRGGKGDGICACNTNDNPVVMKMHGPINECDQTVTLTANSNAGFNFISNPYASDIDMSLATRGNAIGANFSVWDPNQGLVGAYVDQPFSLSYILPAYSSFFTTCNSNAGKTITFHETDKTSASPTGNLFKTTGLGNNIVQLRILSNNDSLSWDRLLLMFNDNALAGTDQLDGTKLLNPDLSFYTFSGDNDQLAVDQRPYVSGQVVKLGISTDVNQTYSIRVDDYSLPAGGVLYLHDKYLNQVQQLQQGMHYSFAVTTDAASQGDNRFELNVSGTAGIANVSSTSEMKVDMFPNPATDNATISYEAPVRGNTTLIVTNLVGQQVYMNQLGQQQTGKVSLPLNTLASGIYMVTLKCGDFSVTKRLAKQ